MVLTEGAIFGEIIELQTESGGRLDRRVSRGK